MGIFKGAEHANERRRGDELGLKTLLIQKKPIPRQRMDYARWTVTAWMYPNVLGAVSWMRSSIWKRDRLVCWDVFVCCVHAHLLEFCYSWFGPRGRFSLQIRAFLARSLTLVKNKLKFLVDRKLI